jgi:hypothetical protein
MKPDGSPINDSIIIADLQIQRGKGDLLLDETLRLSLELDCEPM